MKKNYLIYLFLLVLCVSCSSSQSDARVYDSVVDINGTGDFTSLQQAIDSMPSGRTAPWLIFVKNGRYEELIRVPAEKSFIHLIGQDKDNVIITYKINCANPENENDSGREFSRITMGEKNCATMVVSSSDFYAENISFENSWGVEEKSGPQALALRMEGDRSAFYNCRFRSFQDTWMTSTKGLNDRTYATDCWIEGAVDYFYGGGNAYVENSTFYNVRSGSVIVAPSHKEGTKWGYIFNNCIVDGNQAAADGKSKLGRPWHHGPIAVYMNTTIKIPLHPEGWTDMGPAAKLFAEYNSRDADGNPVDLSQRRTWYKQSAGEGGKKIEGLKAILNSEDVAEYTYENIIEGDDNWNPKAFFEKIVKPANLQLASNGSLSWSADTDAIGYIIYGDDEVIGFSDSNSYKSDKKAESYTVQAVNKYGSLGEMSDRVN